MLIELQEPFKSLWRKGYLVINPENRRNIILFNSEQDRTTISYARYLMCVHLGYILSNEYEVDHKDNDKTNDDINNLQVLTQKQNKLKEQYRYIMEEQVCYGFHCIYCGIPFILTEREVKMRIANNVVNAFCSRSCASSFYGHKISDETIYKIKQLKLNNLSSRKIAELTGLSRNTIMKYW